MKILFLHNNIPSYVTDGLFHGLHSLGKHLVVDYPRNDVMYDDATPEILSKTASRGGTLYGLLKEPKDIVNHRTYWQRDLQSYDIIIIADIANDAGIFDFVYHRLPKNLLHKLCIVDGYDYPSLFPYFNIREHFKFHKWYFRLPVKDVAIFKREIYAKHELYGVSRMNNKMFSKFLDFFLRYPKQLQSISISIPLSLIEQVNFLEKTKTFVSYNVDKDLESLFEKADTKETGKWMPAFENQEAYFEDIRQSRFGITVKRKGWDCLRHYEYAAKGAILCFKDLDSKPSLSAPYGLTPSNCIRYKTKEDLLAKITSISTDDLMELQQKSYQWVRENTTIKVAERFLSHMSKIPINES